jgi:NADH:ubiquinone oxidoreductase subunit E
MLGQEFEAKVDEIVSRYPEPKAALLMLLWEVQERKGWVDLESEVWIAERLGVSPAHVHGTVTFYTMYKQKPSGKYHIQVCTGLSCMLRGSDTLMDHLSSR